MIAHLHGIVLVTGPTGSGKTTTLNALLREVASDRVKAVTIEDPVEYRIAGVDQIQTDERIGLTFDSLLRRVLRQDPDVIVVGEIRDAPTAALALRAALTGHLVLSTLHTNDAVSSITRLRDLGVEPWLLAACCGGRRSGSYGRCARPASARQSRWPASARSSRPMDSPPRASRGGRAARRAAAPASGAARRWSSCSPWTSGSRRRSRGGSAPRSVATSAHMASRTGEKRPWRWREGVTMAAEARRGDGLRRSIVRVATATGEPCVKPLEESGLQDNGGTLTCGTRRVAAVAVDRRRLRARATLRSHATYA
jgi:energy-coupling factor transporter ATP-binding protein EcfA2